MMDSYPIARELVLVGGGHSHVIFLRMLGMNPIPGLQVTLISPDSATPYSGMLPGLIAGHYQPDEIYIDLVPLCRFAGVNFIQAEVTGMEVTSQHVCTTTRPPIHYDLVSIDIGSRPSLGSLPASEQIIPVKPIGHLLKRWQAFIERFHEGAIKEIGFVGAGAGGVELCLAVQHHLQTNFPEKKCHVNLFTDGKTILNEFDASLRIRFEKLLVRAGIQVHRDFRAEDFVDGQLCSDDQRKVRLDEIFWITQAGIQSWPAESGLAVDAAGFIQVGDTLQSLSHDNVFAVGDCATMVNHPRPKAGVYAVRQGKPLFENISAIVLKKKPNHYKPQSRFLSLISTGPQYAIAARNGFSLEGKWVWRWKNWIDQRFMQRFTQLPRMSSKPVNALQEEFDDQMHCGGCGSKVSSEILGEVLNELMGDAAPSDDAAIIEVPENKLLLQSVDHFRSFINDPYQQARIAVSHALSDIYACGGKPVSAMALITLPFAKPGVTKSMLTQIMTGTLHQLTDEGLSLVGGHTSEGMELSIGFAVNGLVAASDIWRKDSLRCDDVLILTKALGTGAILAADMQHRARGDWVRAALLSMAQSNRQAAEILRSCDVSACTDVTGFGLAGHCLEMIGKNELGIELNLESLPILGGAMNCIEALNITSSLHGANKRASGLTGLSRDAEILFDPQTSGGLLACIPADQANSCIDRLKEAGFEQADRIGHVTARSGLSIV